MKHSQFYPSPIVNPLLPIPTPSSLYPANTSISFRVGKPPFKSVSQNITLQSTFTEPVVIYDAKLPVRADGTELFKVRKSTHSSTREMPSLSSLQLEGSYMTVVASFVVRLHSTCQLFSAASSSGQNGEDALRNSTRSREPHPHFSGVHAHLVRLHGVHRCSAVQQCVHLLHPCLLLRR